MLISCLSNTNLRISVCDESWKESPYSDKLNFVLATTTDEILEIYKRSKILIQDMAEFNDGSHCRIADGTLCNTVVISEYSSYVNEFFNSSALFMYKWDEFEKLPFAIKKILNKNRQNTLKQ